MTKDKEKFFEILKNRDCGIFYNCTPANLALQVLKDYLLGED